MSTPRFQIYAPLQEFPWDGDQFELASGLRIRRYEERPDLQGLYETLGQTEQQNVSSTRHWLTFEWYDGAEPSPGEIANLVLLALWVVKPTKTHIAFRFHLEHHEPTNPWKDSTCQLLDRFVWWKGASHDELDDQDLKLAANYYSVLRGLHIASGRLNDAMILTLTGCWSHRWQVAMICHAAAAEAILTYSTKPGITKRLSTSYACLVETHTTLRDAAYREFYSLYSVRSDIMHGRTNNILVADRRPLLARFEEVLRRLWRVVVVSPSLVNVLEGPDTQREAYFLKLMSAYSPPP